MLFGIVRAMIHAETQRDVSPIRGRTDDDFLRARRQMHRGLVARGEESGRFDHHLHAELAPRQLGRIAFGEDLEGVRIDHDLIALGLDRMAQIPVDRIVFKQMRERRRVGDIVNRDNLEFFLVHRRAIKHTADTAEAVDSDPDRHC
jgi:hypothetical protein